MNKIIGLLLFSLFAGCCNCNNQIADNVKLKKAIKLAEQIEMNDYKLVATNGTMMLIKLSN